MGAYHQICYQNNFQKYDSVPSYISLVDWNILCKMETNLVVGTIAIFVANVVAMREK